MIIFRNYKEDDYDLVNKFLLGLDINFNKERGITYLALDDDRLIGLTRVEENKDKWYLDFIYIAEGERKKGLGDGLFRALLNKLRNNNIKSIFFNSNSNYLINKGFCYNIDNELELNIDKFFSTSNCGSCGG